MIAGDLFSQPPRYTIDTSSLIDIFGTEKFASKSVTPGLWDNIARLIASGEIISHIEVKQEIKKCEDKGEDLYDWAQANGHVFMDYDLHHEGQIIRTMSSKYAAFVNGKDKAVHADPWLVAQAKHLGITIISEETFVHGSSPKIPKIPNVCRDQLFNVDCVTLFELAKREGWTFKA